MPFLGRWAASILKKWDPSYSLGVEVVTALWFRESVQLVLVKGPGLMCEGLRTEGSGYPGAQCLLLLGSGKCRDWPLPWLAFCTMGQELSCWGSILDWWLELELDSFSLGVPYVVGSAIPKGHS